MTTPAIVPPLLDPRALDEIVDDLRAERPAYVPGWEPGEKGTGAALIQVLGHDVRAVAERVNQAPAKNELAFLDLLGVSELSAQAARAAVVFTSLPNSDGRVPAGARVGAKLPDRSDPLVFEVERAIALAAARLAEVYSLWPGRDAYADHTDAALGGRPFTLFEPLALVPHELYLGHDTHFALTGRAIIEVTFEITTGSSAALRVAWEYWDGEVWRAFKDWGTTELDSVDGTDGLTRSGIVRLVADCATTARRKVWGTSTYWIRARLIDAYPPSVSLIAPVVDRVQLRTELRRVIDSTSCDGGMLPDSAISDGQKLDLTKSFRPLGQNPLAGAALYLMCDDAFTRPGAHVTLCLDKATTAEEESDTLSRGYEVSINAAEQKIQDLIALLQQGADFMRGIVDANVGALRQIVTDLFQQDPQAWWDTVRKPLDDALAFIQKAALPDPSNASADLLSSLGSIFGGWVADIASLVTAGVSSLIFPSDKALGVPHAIRHLGRAAFAITGDSSLTARIDALTDALDHGIGDPAAAAADLVRAIQQLPSAVTLPAVVPSLIQDAFDLYNDIKQRIDDARTEVTNAIAKLLDFQSVFNALEPSELAAHSGITPPTLTSAQLEWEYFDGKRWRPIGAQGADGARNFTASGRIEFDVPTDWERASVNGSPGLWLRVRLAAGSYNRIRQVSWYDAQAKHTNYITIFEPRPPVLDALRIGYVWRSAAETPQHTSSYNDFTWRDHDAAAQWRGDPFEPFLPVADTTPSLYLGFDRPLPPDNVSLLFDIVEQEGETSGQALRWETWDGTEWIPFTVRDETANLVLPGIVAGPWPVDPPPSPVAVARAEGSSIELVDRMLASRFVEDDVLYLVSGQDAELVRVASTAQGIIATRTPLERAHKSASISRAPLPRFGTPRSWVRARLASDAEPRHTVMRGIHVNAAWAAQVQTFQDELLGSGRGEPSLTLFFPRSPVLPGQRVEVRELDGARANVEWPMLRDELVATGIAEADVRLVRDSRTNRITEVWVPWIERQTLGFSSPADRHYVIERAHGRLQFGDDRHGRIVPAGRDNVRAAQYRVGGGRDGNVAARTITQLLSNVSAQSAVNPRAAEGGADGEPLESVLVRGPRLMRHKRQAIAASDYEALAREASPAVAVAKALPTTDPRGRFVPGWVRLIIVPQSSEPRPQPTFLLRELVREFIAARAPATVGQRLTVIGPSYLPIGVTTTVVPVRPDDAGPLRDAVERAITSFLHPLFGGPQQGGWPFGRDVFLSDVAALVESIDGVDYARELGLTVSGSPAGDSVNVPNDRIVVAGTLRVQLAGGER